MRNHLLAAMACLSLATAASADYPQAIRQTAAMVSNPQAQQMAGKHGLQILNLTWEDTGRYKGSSVGPNISDMTLQVQNKNQLTCLPVIRFPNFEDKTADLQMDDFYLLVGNQNKGEKLHRVTLREYLGNFRSYLTHPESWKGNGQSLLAERDKHVLVSAQACFLPIPPKGECEFNPVLFNYQSTKGAPAVLTILATREGTSATIIDNVRDGFDAGGTWGQRLFFNQAGERASLTGKRLSEFVASQPTTGSATHQANGEKGLNMVLMVQVPLKYPEIQRRAGGYDACCEAVPAPCARSRTEDAVIGHGKVEGPYTEVDGLAIERDPRFPVRVTVQFYKATADGQVTDADVAGIAAQLDKVYANADYVGSLVTQGETNRPTEYDGPKQQPADWWQQFWLRHQKNTGQTWYDVQNLWARLGLKARN